MFHLQFLRESPTTSLHSLDDDAENLKQLFYGTYDVLTCMTYFINTQHFSLFFPQVRWMMQQHEKIRKKRDTYTPVRFPGQSSRGRDPIALLRSIARGTHVRLRSTDSHLIFPDPLFKEQWYMVSTKNIFMLFRTRLFVSEIYCVNEMKWMNGP